MRFFHISDLHLGLKLLNRDLEEDQRFILEEIVEAVKIKKPDVVVIAGDIYNNSVPSADGIQLFDNFILDLKNTDDTLKILIISGNHDNENRINQFRNILDKQNIHMIGVPPKNKDEYIEQVELRDEFGVVKFYLLPFVTPLSIKKIVNTEDEEDILTYDEALRRLIKRENIDKSIRNIIVSHQFYIPRGENPENIERMDSETKITVGNIDAVYSDMLEDFDYAALGHIHKPMKVIGEFHRYSGTPLACSISEAGQKKGIIMVDMFEKGNISTEVIPLKPLREIKVLEGSVEEILKNASNDFVVVVLTGEGNIDFEDVNSIRNNFPNLLEIRREAFKIENNKKAIDIKELSVIDICKEFLGPLDNDEDELLIKIVNGIGR